MGLLEFSKNGILCITETLRNVETTLGPITAYDTIENPISGDLPVNVTCTDCIKAHFTLNADIFMGTDITDANSTLQKKCGPSFVGASITNTYELSNLRFV